MEASDIMARAGRQLKDPDHVRWTKDELVDYINDAQRQIVLVRPDANSRTEAFALAAGSKQSLPAGGMALLRVVRNLGDDGTTPGRVVFPTLRSSLDAETPDWHVRAGATVQHFIYDPRVDRRTFYVYPFVEGGFVEIVYSKAPDKAGENDTLELPDEFINPVLDWVLYRCYGKDAEAGGNMNRSQSHINNFYQELGINAEASEVSNPTRRVRGAEMELR